MPLGGAVEWVVIAYLVAATALLLTAGRLADLFGRIIVWPTGLVLFTASSALCTLAPSLGMLIAARMYLSRILGLSPTLSVPACSLWMEISFSIVLRRKTLYEERGE